ncbi:hypothetical protein J3459_012131 [Metarhizium acridum]|nr:hypothetical protein J3459_012131 [Metarhizium acridum]
MLLSSAAVVLGALQPALGKPSLLRRQMDGTKNEVVNQRLAATEIVIDYLAPNPPCGPYTPWVGIWPADACNSFAAETNVWLHVKPTKGRDIGNVTLDLTKLKAGEYKAAFVCEDGKRQAWMVSQPFQVDKEAPPAKKKQGERCYEANDCGDGLFCEHQCGGPIENYKSAMCFIAGEPKCRPIRQEQPAKKKQGERCYEANDCGDGLFCEHQCGGPIENYKSAMCFIAGEPKCRPIRQEQPAKKKQGERCSQVNECGDGLFCRHPCGGAIDDESNVCLIGGEPTCAPVKQEQPAKKKQGERCSQVDECGDGLFCQHPCGGAIDDESNVCFIGGEPTCAPVGQEQPAKKKQGERCYKADDCDHGLFCQHQCGGAIDDPRPALCLIAGEPTCAPVRQS